MHLHQYFHVGRFFPTLQQPMVSSEDEKSSSFEHLWMSKKPITVRISCSRLKSWMSITVDDETIMTVSLGPCQINFYSLISRVVLKHFMFQSNYSLGVCKKKGLADLSLSPVLKDQKTLWVTLESLMHVVQKYPLWFVHASPDKDKAVVKCIKLLWWEKRGTKSTASSES